MAEPTSNGDEVFTADIEQAVAAALKFEGLRVVPQFLVPGASRTAVDFYIPSLPRSIIEIKVCRSSDVALEGIHQLLNHGSLASEFGDGLLFFLVLFGQFDSRMREQVERRLAQLPNALVIYEGPLSEPIADLASSAAEKIQNFRVSRNPLIYIQLDQINTSEDTSQRPLKSDELDALVKSINNDGLIKPLLVCELSNQRYSLVDGHRRLAALHRLREESTVSANGELFDRVPAIRISKELPLQWNVPSTDVRGQFAPLLQTLIELVQNRDRVDVILHEFEQLCQEHKQGHYTSCALRVGRFLEFVVYSLAVDWGVRVNEPMLQVIETLNQETRALNSLFLDFYDASTSSEQKQQEAKLRKGIGKLQSGILNLIDQVHTPEFKEKRNPTATRNVEAILRDIKKTHSRYPVVRKTLDSIFKEQLIQKIISFRNSAAHADPQLNIREIEYSVIGDMVENLRDVIQRLINVGEAIQSEARAEE